MPSCPKASAGLLWPAKNAGIPIVVKGIQVPEFQGMVISSSAKAGNGPISGVIADSDCLRNWTLGIGASSIIFSSLAKSGENIRFIAQISSEYSISFAVREKYADRVSKVLNSLFENNAILPIDDVMIVNQRVGIITV